MSAFFFNDLFNFLSFPNFNFKHCHVLLKINKTRRIKENETLIFWRGEEAVTEN